MNDFGVLVNDAYIGTNLFEFSSLCLSSCISCQCDFQVLVVIVENEAHVHVHVRVASCQCECVSLSTHGCEGHPSTHKVLEGLDPSALPIPDRTRDVYPVTKMLVFGKRRQMWFYM